MQTTSVHLRDLACDLEQSLTVSFIFDGLGLDLWDVLQLGYVDMQRDYQTLTVGSVLAGSGVTNK
jgi:hypothetical protein